MDGLEIPSMADLIYYVGDWALKYPKLYFYYPLYLLLLLLILFALSNAFPFPL